MNDMSNFNPEDFVPLKNGIGDLVKGIDMSNLGNLQIPQLNLPSFDYNFDIPHPIDETNKLLEENNKSTQRSEYELNKVNAQFRSLNIQIDKQNETINRLEGEITSLKTSLAKLENPHYWKKSIAITLGCGSLLTLFNIVLSVFILK